VERGVILVVIIRWIKAIDHSGKQDRSSISGINATMNVKKCTFLLRMNIPASKNMQTQVLV